MNWLDEIEAANRAHYHITASCISWLSNQSKAPKPRKCTYITYTHTNVHTYIHTIQVDTSINNSHVYDQFCFKYSILILFDRQRGKLVGTEAEIWNSSSSFFAFTKIKYIGSKSIESSYTCFHPFPMKIKSFHYFTINIMVFINDNKIIKS